MILPKELTPAEQEVVEAIEPLTYQVLIRPIEPQKQSDGGIILPPKVQKNEEFLNVVGRVLALGPLVFNHPKFSDTQPYGVGDYVLYGQYSGKRIPLTDDRLVIILHDDQIICKIHNPAAIIRQR